MTKAEVIDSFSGEHRFLSNFYVDKTGLTAEHLFQASKTRDKREILQILTAHSPGVAKRMGRVCTLRPDWEIVKDDLMYQIVRHKFRDPDLAKKLTDTGNAILIEGNHWGDKYWGVCDGKGLNKLGEILMRVRDELKSDQ